MDRWIEGFESGGVYFDRDAKELVNNSDADRDEIIRARYMLKMAAMHGRW